MKFVYTTVLLLLCFHYGFADEVASVYYSVDMNEPIDMKLMNKNESLNYYRQGNVRGCSCFELVCGCCSGFNIPLFNFNRVGCMNLTYDPEGFAINMNMLLNNESVYTNSISAKNPPPICYPIPIPILPTVDFCVKLFNIFTPGQNLHMCMDFETRIQRASIFILHFDCMRMGRDGVAFLKPEENGGLTTMTSDILTQENADIFDPVTEIKIEKLNFTTP